ncbi:MHYT domain-containing protein [Ramlibacter sp. PS3R-8]|uniref:MHYT domain-containing protein n=1 Tax=Ramlibacter sp. PS3R-8 TaxID=3133437 RepID=UPI00309531A6
MALTAANRMRQGNGRISLINTLSAGLALGGIGVWSMHFIGMVALKLDVATGYSMLETIVSLVAAILATALALLLVAKRPDHFPTLLGAGFMLGMGVVVMHYLGMFGMRFAGFIRWNFLVIGLSACIAVVAATAALWLAFNTRTLGPRICAALLMGVAVCSMHYTGMNAAEFVCTSANRVTPPSGLGVVNALDLPSLVAAVALCIAALISIDQFFQGADTKMRLARAAARAR